ncbi:conserved hypothetical protein [Talaromyces stipitatus ATCC 10500]|uniref:Gamma-glutamylcyclotransferase AIG2-like domain-containing protein n=1 Tax=Talaromyces stipitatus (strain ATCC 10500 / CBS 375.48 / QM 6759 / NRRL 1006) TaxID=441959 RepID=B8M9Z8_TALSN|nr:uncharacterized protein TSTA_119140 [Talaromyces stipitatus ATCC 10500]EED18150.1 conserved hypothetical protein [Talaromyces stipitatus ATCC 10500]
MLQSAPEDYLLQRPEQRAFSPKFPLHLSCKESSTYRKNHNTAKWGDYPALIDGKQGEVVTGYACIVQTKEEAQKLSYYETSAYEVVSCRIYFKDEEVSKELLWYAGDTQALLEQRFDRKLWKLQMGDKLR